RATAVPRPAELARQTRRRVRTLFRAYQDCRAGFAGRDMQGVRATERPTLASRSGLDLLDPARRPAPAPPTLPALRADAVELHPVTAHDEAEEARDPLLELLELLAVELDDLPAALADDVVVMLLGGLGGLVAGLPVVEVTLVRQPAFLEQLEGPVDRRIADARVHLLHGRVQLLDREVLARAEEGARDVVALRSRLEAPLAQRLLEESHAGAHHARDPTPRCCRAAPARAAARATRSASRCPAHRARHAGPRAARRARGGDRGTARPRRARGRDRCARGTRPRAAGSPRARAGRAGWRAPSAPRRAPPPAGSRRTFWRARRTFASGQDALRSLRVRHPRARARSEGPHPDHHHPPPPPPLPPSPRPP